MSTVSPPSTKPSSINSKESVHPPAQTLGRTSPMLSYFCVYNPSLGPTEETNKDQILYYTAKRTVPLDMKMRQVGLAQALVNFTKVFSPTRPAQTVHSQKNRMVFLEPEPGFWVHMCVELGISRRQVKDANSGKFKTITEYLDAELSDRALEGILEVGYRMYRLLNGTFSSTLHSHSSSTDPALITRQSTRQLMNAIEEFFADWIWRWDFDRLESMVFASVFDGVPFHPLTKGTYVHIQRVGEMLASRLGGVVGHMMVLGKEDGGLVWHSSGLVMRDVRSLRKYVGKLVEKDAEREREEEKKRLAAAKLKKEGEKVSNLKSVTKTWSHTGLLGYFSGTPSASTSTSVLGSKRVGTSPTPSPSISTPSSPEPKKSLALPGSEAVAAAIPSGKFLTGLVETASMIDGGTKGTRMDLVKVYLSNTQIVEVKREEEVAEKNEKTVNPEADGETNETTEEEEAEKSGEEKEQEDEDEDAEEEEAEVVEEDIVEEDDVDRSEFYLVVYKHKSNLTWVFLLPTSNDVVTEKVTDPQLYRDLERLLIEQRMDDTVRMVEADWEKGRKVGSDADKEYRYVYFNNLTLAIKSTLVNTPSRSPIPSTSTRSVTATRPSATAAQATGNGAGASASGSATQSLVITNEMLQQVLDLKEDFERLSDLNEVYTRSTANHWVVGRRVASVANVKSSKNKIGNSNGNVRDMNAGEDTRELYLVAAKKDMTLVDVEDDMRRLSAFISSGVFLE